MEGPLRPPNEPLDIPPNEGVPPNPVVVIRILLGGCSASSLLSLSLSSLLFLDEKLCADGNAVEAGAETDAPMPPKLIEDDAPKEAVWPVVPAPQAIEAGAKLFEEAEESVDAVVGVIFVANPNEGVVVAILNVLATVDDVAVDTVLDTSFDTSFTGKLNPGAPGAALFIVSSMPNWAAVKGFCTDCWALG